MTVRSLLVVGDIPGDMRGELVTPDPSAPGPRPAAIVQVCLGSGSSLVVVGVRAPYERLHSIVVSESGEEVEVAAWTGSRRTGAGCGGDLVGILVRRVLWAALVPLGEPLGGRRVVAS
ncbi:MAG: hypothetical protein ACRDYD_02775 [Acidimicrobiales bacterium]